MSDVYEAGTTRLFQVLLKPGMTVVDVGAHIGYYTVLASRLVREEGRVYAFEPDPDTFAVLIENIKTKAIPNVLPIQKAVADRIGDAILYLGKERIDRFMMQAGIACTKVKKPVWIIL
jgi:FkbM family methyltransferase